VQRAATALLRLIRLGLIGLTVCYAVLLALVVLGWQIDAGDGWLLAVSNIFAIYLFLPLLPLLLLAPLLRSRVFWLATTMPLLLFVLLFYRLLLPPNVEAAPPRLRVMTLNALYVNRAYANMLAFVRARDAGVLAVQELDPRMAEALTQGLADLYPYHTTYAASNWEGLGVWSRYPIVSARAYEGQRYIELTLDVDGQFVHLINAHPHAPYMQVRNYRRLPLPQPQTFSTDERDRLIAGLAAQIDRAPRPLIVLGDLNLTEREQPYRDLAARLDDAFDVAGWGLGATFPVRHNAGDSRWLSARLPLVRIDYVWSSPELPAQRAEVRCDLPGSDHCALLVDLGLRPAQEQVSTDSKS